jgi:hypothetical protein
MEATPEYKECSSWFQFPENGDSLPNDDTETKDRYLNIVASDAPHPLLFPRSSDKSDFPINLVLLFKRK